MSLAEGMPAPPFEGVDQNGNSIRLQDLRGRKVILYFYPKDDTPGCTKEACNLRDNYAALQEAGYTIIGVSADTIESHKKFAEKYHLPFSLLADPEKKIISAYQAWGKKKLYGKEYEGTLRITYIIDENGIISRIIKNVKPEQHASQILGT
jgi:thioredoxin-dependent peroxiredoxin